MLVSWRSSGLGGIRVRDPEDGLSESALQQAVAATARRTDFLGAEPFHHVAGVPSVATGQTEVGRAPHGHVADGTLEGKAFADGTLNAAHFASAIAAKDAKLCQGSKRERGDWRGCHN